MTPYSTSVSSFFPATRSAQDTRDKRKQVLAAVRQRRRQIYIQFMKKQRRLQASSDMV